MNKKRSVALKNKTIDEFSQTANIYDDSGKYEMVKDDYTAVSKEVERETFGRLLDCGCGTGNFISMMASHYPDRFFTGIDITPKMIEVAEAKRINGATFTVCDSESISSGDVMYDVITCIHSFHHYCDPLLFFESASRNLVTGGRFIICDNACRNGLHYFWKNHVMLPLYYNRIKGLGDVHYYNEKEILILCNKSGFELERFYKPDKETYVCTMRKL